MVNESRNTIVLEEQITKQEILELLATPCLKSDGSFVLPQANNFNRIDRIIRFIGKSETMTKEIEMSEGFSSRQASYYLYAINYLGLANKTGPGRYSLTSAGKMLLGLKSKERCLEYSKLILSHRPFNDFFRLCVSLKQIADKAELLKSLVSVSSLKAGSKTTLIRRADTIRSWITWIFSLAEEHIF